MSILSFPNEPNVWIGLATGIIGAVAVFWPNFLTPDQQKAVIGLVVLVVPIVLSFVSRSQVTPTATLTSLGVTITPATATTTQVATITPPPVVPVAPLPVPPPSPPPAA
jgi:drug/metabolite transporter (DMT)-like permease